MIKINANEAQLRLPELLAAASAGEMVEISQNGTTFRLMAVAPRTARPRPPVTGVPKAGQFKGMFVVPDDFDEPLDDLRE